MKNRSRPRRAICVHWDFDDLMGCSVRDEQNIAGVVELNAICTEWRREACVGSVDARTRLEQRVTAPRCQRAAAGARFPDNTVKRNPICRHSLAYRR